MVVLFLDAELLAKAHRIFAAISECSMQKMLLFKKISLVAKHMIIFRLWPNMTASVWLELKMHLKLIVNIII